MPIWAQVIVATALVLTSAIAIWTKALRPLVRFISLSEKMVPLLVQFTKVFEDTPTAFSILEEIASEFRTDAGSSLRDVIDRIDDASKEAKTAADVLKVGVEAQRILNEARDRKLERLLVLLDRLTIKVETNTKTTHRVEEAQEVVRRDLEVAKQTAEAVAAVVGVEAGAAADAAAVTPASPHPPLKYDEDVSDLILDDLDRRTGDLTQRGPINRDTGELKGPAKIDNRKGGLP